MLNLKKSRAVNAEVRRRSSPRSLPGLKAQNSLDPFPGLEAGAPTARRKRRNWTLLMLESIAEVHHPSLIAVERGKR